MLKALIPEKYDLLFAEITANKPEPARCAAHTDFVKHATACDACRIYRNWRAAVIRRFSARGFSFRPLSHVGPEPVCPDRHGNAKARYDDCQACRRIINWRKYRDAHGEVRSFRDIDRLAAHVRALEAAGMPAVEIAERSGVHRRVVRRLTTRPPRWIKIAAATAILAVPVPVKVRSLVPDARGRVRRRVDPTGTRRRAQAAVVNSHTLAAVADMLGWSRATVNRWTSVNEMPGSVSIDAADDMAALYPRLMSIPGSSPASARIGRAKGWISGRYFSEANIDDPTYQPFAVILEPWGLRRRLQGLAWLGHGPERIAPLIGEPPDRVRAWMLGGSAPAYATHLVIPVYERLSFTQGDDHEVAGLARRKGWTPPLAWDDIDIDRHTARPHVDLPSNYSGKTRHVLTSMVFDALDGRTPADQLLKPEKVQVVWTLHRRGWSDRRIAAWLQWIPGSADLGQRAVTKFREREQIRGFGIDDGYSHADEGLILWGAAA